MVFDLFSLFHWDIHGYRFLVVCLVIFWPLMPEACSNTSG